MRVAAKIEISDTDMRGNKHPPSLDLVDDEGYVMSSLPIEELVKVLFPKSVPVGVGYDTPVYPLRDTNSARKSKNTIAQALKDFTDAIESTGGVRQTKDGYVPVADEDWLDLGEAYVSACEALGSEPLIEKEMCECGREADSCSFDPEDETSKHGDN